MVTLLSKEDCESVRAAIAEAERSTSGEIRVLVVGSSARPAAAVGSMTAALVGTAVYAWLARAAWGYPEVADLLGAAGAAFAAGAVVAWLLPRLRAAAAVRHRAEREFVRLGIANTAGRTGALIMLSERERRAVLLADRGIHEKVPAGTWDGIVTPLVKAIREGRAADAVTDAVREVGRHLAAHFPRRPDDVNELPDAVETRR